MRVHVCMHGCHTSGSLKYISRRWSRVNQRFLKPSVCYKDELKDKESNSNNTLGRTTTTTTTLCRLFKRCKKKIKCNGGKCHEKYNTISLEINDIK